MRRILILGASGYLGRISYKELTPYLDLHGTYFSADQYENNQVMHRFDLESDSIAALLRELLPTEIIYALDGPYPEQQQALKVIVEYCRAEKARLIFFSSVAVFDAVNSHASYENDKPLPQSAYGKHLTQMERICGDLPAPLYSILRLPLVLGTNAPLIKQLRAAHQHKAHFEVNPNQIISVNTEQEVARQLHYIINRKLSGIFHLSSTDLIHHSDLFLELSQKLGLTEMIFAYNYSSNDDEYYALLPKYNLLPAEYRNSVANLVNQVVLNEQISIFSTKKH
ncbi:sugar nucleotide-binding protein [Gilvibacter sp.]|uniref:sugar nucleotide-binding protein n=1 Tax=Gilvibacter sp. TaxID=2729997 RepID=UPI0025C30FBE|nr:sugar nucleotide-binding protein [Gilvibacter sp.]NQX78150.1 sugar nucleotide-binding protein [Gilvibacter sp.]